MSALPGPSPRPSWDEYLDAVEAAALDVRESLLAGRSPLLPDLPLPSGRPAPHQEVRRQAVAGLVDEVTRFISSQQAAVRARIDALPHPSRPSMANPESSLGSGFDLRG